MLNPHPLSLEEAKRRATLRFTEAEFNRANEEWGANCGPGAIAAICGLTLAELRPHLGDFEAKRFTNPTLMWSILQRLFDASVLTGVTRKTHSDEVSPAWPIFGLARVQWEGPWTKPGVPIAARYRHTHWVGAMRIEAQSSPIIFDVNAIHVGGWTDLHPWSEYLVPWILQECQPKADGRWHLTHSVEIERRA